MILKLLSYNIRYGGSAREQHLSAVIRKEAPDVVVFQEATQPRIIELLAEQTDMRFWGARPGYSLGFISRVEIAHHEWHRPPGARHPFIELVPASLNLRIFGLHLSAIHSNWTERRRVRELRALLTGIEQHQQGFHVIVGDFNTLAPGELLETRRLPARLQMLVWLSGGRIRWQTIQMLLDDNYVDGYRILYPLEKGFTFPTWNPHVRLDYLFLPTVFVKRLKDCQVVQGYTEVVKASDHFPLLAQLEVD